MVSEADQHVVLVVEDDQGCIELITELVEDLGHPVITCSSVEDAIRILSERPVSLVILDVMLPDGDGFSVLASIRTNPSIRTLPVILCTAALFEVTAFDKPVDDPLTEIVAKPFHIESFMRVLPQVVEEL